MTTARKHIVDPETCRYYHCIGRCVQRAFLCGVDAATGRNYEYRRQWIIDRLETLAQAFCIDVAGYGIMSNHYHLIVHLNPGANDRWSADEVFARWTMLNNAPQWVRDVRAGKGTVAQEAAYDSWIKDRRGYLGNLSWFMKLLNEPIARAANRESGASGAFWQGRFRSQALLNEQALLACLAYVDLNPIRARLAKTPEASEYTSIRQRIRRIVNEPPETHLPLMSFADEVSREAETPTIPCTLTAYINLVEMTGRAIRSDKSGAIPSSTPAILDRLGYDEQTWLSAVKAFGQSAKLAAGSRRNLDDFAKATRGPTRRWFNGFKEFGRYFE